MLMSDSAHYEKSAKKDVSEGTTDSKDKAQSAEPEKKKEDKKHNKEKHDEKHDKPEHVIKAGNSVRTKLEKLFTLHGPHSPIGWVLRYIKSKFLGIPMEIPMDTTKPTEAPKDNSHQAHAVHDHPQGSHIGKNNPKPADAHSNHGHGH